MTIQTVDDRIKRMIFTLSELRAHLENLGKYLKSKTTLDIDLHDQFDVGYLKGTGFVLDGRESDMAVPLGYTFDEALRTIDLMVSIKETSNLTHKIIFLGNCIAPAESMPEK